MVGDPVKGNQIHQQRAHDQILEIQHYPRTRKIISLVPTKLSQILRIPGFPKESHKSRVGKEKYQKYNYNKEYKYREN
jgi:hypothetical protein